jgi:arginine-tRNA-protein transferase
MQARHLPIFDDISFNPHYVEQYIAMQSFKPDMFDLLCADGWTYWADLLFRRNYWEWRGQPCRVILLRIDLRGFTFSKSQRKCLRRNADLQMVRRPIRVRAMHERLFRRHAVRFKYNRPMSIYGFFSHFSNMMPCQGEQLELFNKRRRMIACSFFHLGAQSVAGNYCIHDPLEAQRSLGTFTMLKEIELAMAEGYRYYYPGFVYDVPSEFDYKLNFNNLEYFDWWGNWYPLERLPVRDWRAIHGEGSDDIHPIRLLSEEELLALSGDTGDDFDPSLLL